MLFSQMSGAPSNFWENLLHIIISFAIYPRMLNALDHRITHNSSSDSLDSRLLLNPSHPMGLCLTPPSPIKHPGSSVTHLFLGIAQRGGRLFLRFSRISKAELQYESTNLFITSDIKRCNVFLQFQRSYKRALLRFEAQVMFYCVSAPCPLS